MALSLKGEDVMSAKKKTTRQKKISNMVAIQATGERGLLTGENQRYEEAIRRQMDLIKKDYNRLMIDVSKGYGLVKYWVGNQAMVKGEMIRSRFIKNN
jgi:hypothetical protein